jgi:two-component system, chemotaxis family, CheB/CheR fusion protein
MTQMHPVIAIVEDNVSIQRALARLLSTAGWQASPFTSAEAFLHTHLQVVPDCLILDLWLPGMTGVELLEHLAAQGSLLPAIIMTARDDPQLHMRALQAGAVAYFLKPLEGPELLQTVQDALDRRHRSGRA